MSNERLYQGYLIQNNQEAIASGNQISLYEEGENKGYTSNMLTLANKGALLRGKWLAEAIKKDEITEMAHEVLLALTQDNPPGPM